MGISVYNHEGYLDPTACAAVAHTGQKKRQWVPLVYICFADSGDEDTNRELAEKYCRFAVKKGALPVATELFLPQIISKKDNMEAYRLADSIWFSKTEELWIFGRELDPEMNRKKQRAVKKSMNIRYYSKEMEAI